MITDNEIQATKLSPTKKDFYQIWNELLDTASKISERWSPAETNESDPGIVLLKVLTGIADKLNYTVDKNILEAYMPSATQEESMRKLCEMMGYSIKYYQSATTTAVISYRGGTNETGSIEIPKYTVIQNTEKTASFVTTKGTTVSKNSADATVSTAVDIIEGVAVQCDGINGTKLITAELLDDNMRFYLPETQIAENGLFIYNAVKNTEDIYVEDEDKQWDPVYNLNTEPLTTRCYKFGFDSSLRRPYLQFPEDAINLIEDGLFITYVRTNGVNGNVALKTLTSIEHDEADKLIVYNSAAALNGRNIETINQAYNNYKKTIGTFDTLVTCRDYMNYLYTKMSEQNKPIVSNALVTDIRDDINRAYHMVSFDENGIYTKNMAKNDRINCFDLVLYAFTPYNELGDKASYDASFKLSDKAYNESLYCLEDDGIKTISHQILGPETGDILLIKNKLQLRAKITTNYRVNAVEENAILKNVKTALYDRFNARQVDFGEEIPYDDILKCIEQADARIKNVSLDEPEIKTVYYTSTTEDDSKYNEMVLQNVLAGRVPMFNYDTSIKPSLLEKAFTADDSIELPAAAGEYITQIEAIYNPNLSDVSADNPVVVGKNEVIQFRAKNYKTTVTYPAYVNYRLVLHGTVSTAIPAVATTLKDYFSSAGTKITNDATNSYMSEIQMESKEDFDSYVEDTGPLFSKDPNDQNTYNLASWDAESTETQTFYYINLTKDNYGAFRLKCTPSSPTNCIPGADYRFVYKRSAENIYTPGYMVDSTKYKYTDVKVFVSSAGESPLSKYYIMTNVGKNETARAIQNGCDYTLQFNETLDINYTKAITDADGIKTGDVVIDEHYKVGDVIRPSGFSSSGGLCSIDSISGQSKKTINEKDYLVLGTKEQIEIRKPVEVVFTENENDTDVYWVRNNEAALIAEAKAATTNRDYIDLFDGNNTSYTLQDNEYFFYTNKAHTDFGYVGAGTVIEKTGDINLHKAINKQSVSLDEIVEKGIDAAIDWLPCASWHPTGSTLILKEYQYYTLTENDKLVSLTDEADEGDETGSDVKPYDWHGSISSATFKRYKGGTNYEDASLPAIEDGQRWEIATFLNLDVSPTKAQKLGTDDTITLTITNSDGSETTDLKDCSFKTSNILQSTQPITKPYNLKYNEDTEKYSDIVYDLKIRQFRQLEVPTNRSFNNYSVYWTNWDIVKTTDSGAGEELSILVPNNHFALWAIEYITSDSSNPKQGVCLDVKQPSEVQLKIYNYKSPWWSEKTDTVVIGEDSYDRYYLRDGLNIIQIDKSCKIVIRNNSDTTGSIIFGMPDLIKIKYNNADTEESENDGGINPKLCYKGSDISIGAAMADLLSAINKADPNHEFYYNNIMEGNMLIEMNDQIDDDDMSDPHKLYDKNNICNKFVISEIDSDFLSKGITIAKSSKLIR